MKILFLDSPSFGKQDMISAFEEMGHQVSLFYHENLYKYNDKEFDSHFDDFVANQSFDFAFSFNFFPTISNGCNRNHIKYLSFVYDSPQVALYSYTIINPCNYVFIFDKALYADLKGEGISTVYHLPLCVNANRLAQIDNAGSPFGSRFCSDVSFVGSLYNEKHNLFDRMQTLSDYTRGYLDAIMEAQMKVYGYYFIEELLTPDILADMKQSCPYGTQPGGTESDSYIYAYYFIARKLANLERTRLLSAVSAHYDTKLYTPNATPDLPACHNMGTVDYYTEMPFVFHDSKINLNISLRSIRSGIPLRAFDILGAGGFLLSNYQADFFDLFTAGEHFDYYDSQDSLLAKIDYYLSHEAERIDIANHARHTVLSEHTHKHRIQSMLQIAFE